LDIHNYIITSQLEWVGMVEIPIIIMQIIGTYD